MGYQYHFNTVESLSLQESLTALPLSSRLKFLKKSEMITKKSGSLCTEPCAFPQRPKHLSQSRVCPHLASEEPDSQALVKGDCDLQYPNCSMQSSDERNLR